MRINQILACSVACKQYKAWRSDCMVWWSLPAQFSLKTIRTISFFSYEPFVSLYWSISPRSVGEHAVQWRASAWKWHCIFNHIWAQKQHWQCLYLQHNIRHSQFVILVFNYVFPRATVTEKQLVERQVNFWKYFCRGLAFRFSKYAN